MNAALLLAEPEAGTRDFLARHLVDDGFQVVGAAAGGEALELAERSKPDLVLVGMRLPDESGLEVCRRLREGERRQCEQKSRASARVASVEPGRPRHRRRRIAVSRPAGGSPRPRR